MFLKVPSRHSFNYRVNCDQIVVIKLHKRHFALGTLANDVMLFRGEGVGVRITAFVIMTVLFCCQHDKERRRVKKSYNRMTSFSNVPIKDILPSNLASTRNFFMSFLIYFGSENSRKVSHSNEVIIGAGRGSEV